MKILWFDTETTGLSSIKNDIVSLACILEIDGYEQDRLYLEIQPVHWDTISPEALKVNGYTLDKLKSFMSQEEAYAKLTAFLNKHCDKFNRNDKLIPAGHNIIRFDIPFLEEFFRRNNDKYLYSFLDYHNIDTSPLTLTLKAFNMLQVSDTKLVTLARHFNINFNAHNSMSDIETTRKVFYEIKELLTR